MKLDSKNLVLNLLGTDANIQINKKILLTLKLEEAFFLSYLIDQYKYFEREGKLREDGSFYTSNMDIALYTTFNNSQIARVKKSGVEKGLFKISLEDSRTKSYYYLNFDKILEMIGTEKSNMELAYKSRFDSEKIDLEINNLEDIENLKKFTFNELRFYCKENKIKYSGNDKKDNLIKKIIENKNPNLISKSHFSTVNDISFTSEQKNRSLTKNRKLEDGVSDISLTVSEKSITNQEQINQEQNTCHVHEKNKKDEKIESIFHELGINYTDTNEASCLLILNEFEDNKILLEKYLLIIHKQLEKLTNIKNLAALFSKKLKEIDYSLINKIKKENKDNIEKILEEQKKIKDEERRIENSICMDKIIDNFLSLDKEIQENVVNLAEQKFLKENPQTNLDMFKAIKKRSYRSHLRMIYSKLLEIIKDENIKIGEVI
ncbi:hypothetical protein HMPREF2085_01501 [Fusobacterium nucleatum 13_3C]|uniref:Uncharacterized protein n=1 Tax=Fusobacterium nucleatum 13_3C TaxID=1357398 RepID=X7RXJ5_FUSNU|nr:hypothetical protein [Fusobacterium nucleatum]ETZ25829.1 hypothetical protein HMPREF2085_01501 [Fusobacterium nucleatum 13_3C]